MELVTPDETGLLFKPDDFEDLAAQLRTLLTSPGALKRMAVAASARIRSQFSHRTAAARMAEIYEEMLARRDITASKPVLVPRWR